MNLRGELLGKPLMGIVGENIQFPSSGFLARKLYFDEPVGEFFQLPAFAPVLSPLPPGEGVGDWPPLPPGDGQGQLSPLSLRERGRG